MVIKNDKKAGSRAYNRLDIQISQALHFAIELYDSLDYLLVLDYDDDITLYDDISRSNIVSYYQLKTKEDSISISTALTESWISKLYNHLNKPDLIIKELALITNCPVKLTNRSLVTDERTAFLSFNEQTIHAIKKDISEKHSIPISNVDLSKFYHMRTILTIDSHRDLVEKEASDFLYARFPYIKVETMKTIFASVIGTLCKKQSYEHLPDETCIENLHQKKGFSKDDFARIINYSIRINIPGFDEIENFLIKQADSKDIALAYTRILVDSRKNTKTFLDAFNCLENIINNTPFSTEVILWDYCKHCKHIFDQDMPKIAFLYSDTLYIEVLTVCIIISKNFN